MHLLWLKVYAPALEDAPPHATRDAEPHAKTTPVALSTAQDGARADEHASWSVKAAPQTVAPWGRSFASGDLETEQVDEETLVPATALGL